MRRSVVTTELKVDGCMHGYARERGLSACHQQGAAVPAAASRAAAGRAAVALLLLLLVALLLAGARRAAIQVPTIHQVDGAVGVDDKRWHKDLARRSRRLLCGPGRSRQASADLC